MAKFGKASLARRETLHPILQEILDEAIKYFDFTIVCGYRNEEDQEKAFVKGASTKHWPDSKHNTLPSKAVDVGPYHPLFKNVDWENTPRFIYLAAFIMGIAHAKGIKIRWGGDWDGDSFMRDQKFHDRPHLELVD